MFREIVDALFMEEATTEFAGSTIVRDLVISLIFLVQVILAVVLVVWLVKRSKRNGSQCNETSKDFHKPINIAKTKLDYVPDWSTAKQKNRDKFLTLAQLHQESIIGMPVNLNSKSAYQRECKQMNSRPLYNPDLSKRLAALYLSELADNSAEWAQVADKVKAAYPNADTSTWDTLEGFFAYATQFCLDCGAPLTFTMPERETRVEPIVREVKENHSYLADRDTGIRIGYQTVYKQEWVTSVRTKKVVDRQGEYMYVNKCHCTKCNKQAFLGENQLLITVVSGVYSVREYDSDVHEYLPMEKRVSNSFTEVADAVFYSDAFLPIKGIVSDKLYDFLSHPSYLPVCTGTMPQLTNLKK